MSQPRWAAVCAVTLTLGLIPAIPIAAHAADGVTVARGKVLKSDKSPAANRRVTMMAWPTDDVLAAMKVGDKFKMQILDEAVTDAAGNYTLAIPSVDALAPVADTAGIVNVDVVAEDGAGGQSITSVSLPPQLGRAATARVRGLAAPRTLTAADVATVDPLTLGTQGLTQQQMDARYGVAVDTPPGGAFDKSCTTTYSANMGNRTSLIGAHYDNTSGITHDFEFNAGATATTGVGVSATGKYGSFKASGTTAHSSDVTIGFPASTSVQHDYTYYAWGKYLTNCYTQGYDSQSYSVRVRTLAGGATTWSGAAVPSAGYCVTYQAGTRMSKTAGRAKTHTTGSDVSAAIGIDLSSQSGYTSSSKVSFSFSSTRHLCGTTDYPGADKNTGLLVGKA